jgi:hypothetical protein
VQLLVPVDCWYAIGIDVCSAGVPDIEIMYITSGVRGEELRLELDVRGTDGRRERREK